MRPGRLTTAGRASTLRSATSWSILLSPGDRDKNRRRTNPPVKHPSDGGIPVCPVGRGIAEDAARKREGRWDT